MLLSSIYTCTDFWKEEPPKRPVIIPLLFSFTLTVFTDSSDSNLQQSEHLRLKLTTKTRCPKEQERHLLQLVRNLYVVKEPFESLPTINGLPGSVHCHWYILCTITSQQMIHHSGIQDNSIICRSFLTTKSCQTQFNILWNLKMQKCSHLKQVHKSTSNRGHQFWKNTHAHRGKKRRS